MSCAIRMVSHGSGTSTGLSCSPLPSHRDVLPEKQASAACLAAELASERAARSGAVDGLREELEEQLSQALVVMTERVDLKIASLLSKSSCSTLQPGSSREYLKADLEDLQTLFNAEKSATGACLAKVQEELDANRSQIAELAASQTTSTELVRITAEKHSQEERREVLEALSKVCEDIEALQIGHRSSVQHMEGLESRMVGVHARLQDQGETIRRFTQHLEKLQSELFGAVDQAQRRIDKAIEDLELLSQLHSKKIEQLQESVGSVREAVLGDSESTHAALIGEMGKVQGQLRSDIEALWGQALQNQQIVEETVSSQLERRLGEALKQSESGLQAVREEHAGTIKELNTRCSSMLEVLQVQRNKHDDDLAIMVLQHENAMDALSKKLDSRVEGLLDDHHESFEDLRSQQRSLLDQLQKHQSQNSVDLKALACQHQDAMESFRSRHFSSVEGLRKEHSKTLEDLRSDHGSLLERLCRLQEEQSKHSDELFAWASRQQDAIDTIRNKQNCLTEELRDEHSRSIEDFRSTHGSLLEGLQRDHSKHGDELLALAKKHKGAIDAIHLKQDRHLEMLRDEHGGAIVRLQEQQNKHGDELLAMSSRHQETIDAIRTQQDGTMQALQNVGADELALLAEHHALIQELRGQSRRLVQSQAAQDKTSEALRSQVGHTEEAQARLSCELLAIRRQLADSGEPMRLHSGRPGSQAELPSMWQACALEPSSSRLPDKHHCHGGGSAAGLCSEHAPSRPRSSREAEIKSTPYACAVEPDRNQLPATKSMEGNRLEASRCHFAERPATMRSPTSPSSPWWSA